MSDSAGAPQIVTRARRELQLPLARLQTPEASTASLSRAARFVADASGALYNAEVCLAEERDDLATGELKHAMEAMSQALRLVEFEAVHDDSLDAVSESIARALALLYPVVQGRARRRRAVMLGELSGPDTPLAFIPRAPDAPTTRPFVAAPSEREREHRATPRALLEVDIGLLSQSHFYTGLSLDVSRGGVFVATYQPLERGTLVTLYFVLPSGVAVEAPGVVRWTRDATKSAPPGMGVAFEKLSDEAQSAIARYCVQRAPLYHDAGDE